MSTGQHRWLLSGGLASGKSKIRELLASAGVVTIDADRVGHSVLEPGGPAFGDVSARWPSSVEDGEINRSILASVVFKDRSELAVLESMTHPYIFDKIKARVEEVDGTVVVETPILNHGLGDGWQRIVVDCRDEVRLRRAIRSGMTEDDARSRMERQPSRTEWLMAADLVVPNHGDLVELGSTFAKLLPNL